MNGRKFQEIANCLKFETWEQVDKWGNENYPHLYTEGNSYLPTGNSSCLCKAVIMYAGHYHRALNHYLRSYPYGKIWCPVLENIKMIETIMSEMITYPLVEDVICYRYISKSYLEQMKRHARIESGRLHFSRVLERGFMSTTLLPSMYADYLGNQINENTIILEIKANKNSKAMFVTPIAGRQFEAELLLAPRTELRIIKRKGNKISCEIVSQKAIEMIYDPEAPQFFACCKYVY